ncbi:hybrid sensor histidine kinase/response regulator [Leptolyngbya sp. AN03gr2]|uniref:hybrid sensor histidine kinase/response regulator n=1 Tax=unclassified Leptolyngbya TaxID=2650499 RepID=UPI003D310FB2
MTSQPLKSLSEYQRLPRSATDTQYYKQYLETVCNNATLALFVMDEYQQCVYMNPAAEQLTGYTLAEVEGRTLHDVIHHTRPDGTPYPLCECPIDQVFPQNNQEQGEEVFVHRDGHFYPVAYTASPIREEGRIIGTVIEVRDITQEKLAQQAQKGATERERLLRQEAETAKERAETLLQSITDAFAVLDRDWHYVYVNEAATKLLNRTEAQLIGNRMWDVFPDLIGSTIDTEYRRAVQEQRTIGFEFFYPSWNRWYLNRIYPSKAGASIFITDITDRKQTEQALRDSEARFRSLFECNMIPIGIWKVNGELGDANDALLDLIGYTRSELESGQISWKELTPIEWAERDTQAVEETIAQGYCTPYEKEFFHKDGRRIPILISGVKVRGDSWGGFFFAIDLTQLKQTEAELREADSMLASALTAGSIYTWRWRIQDNLVSTDAAFANLFGVDPAAAAKGLPIEFFLDGMHPDDREPVATAIQKAIATGEDYLAEYRVRSADGKLRWVAARGRVEYDAEGKPLSFPGAISDITERKQIEAELEETEERLRLAIESAKLGTWDFNLTTGRIIWNDDCKAMFGVPQDVEITYEIVERGMHPDDRDRVNQEVQAVFEQRSSGEQVIEYRVIGQSDRVERWVSSRGKVFYAADGTPLRWIGTLLDITEVKQREVERQQLLDREKRLREQAEQANRIKDEFLAVLSHELRTPLNPILGWVRMLRADKCPPAKVPQALETIERNARLQSQLIEDLLDVSRILQGKLTLNTDLVNLVDTIKAASETVQLAADAKAIELVLNFDPNVGAIRGDANRLQQVFWNLLSNAVKFTPAAGRVEVSLSQIGTDAEIRIRDTGKGIRSEVLPYIFDRFRQADSSTTRQFGGLGLGLAIARHLVELHGGTIAAESLGENQGATFTVKLPISKFQLQQDTPELPESSRNLAGIKILAVDDEPDNLDFLVFLLEAMGAIVQSASSAMSAFEKLAEFQPDLLISDIAMPDLDGYQLIQQIREQSDVPAIALTAYAGETNQRQILAAGFQQHLAKPVDPDELVNAIVALLN